GSSLKRNISMGNCLGGTLPNTSENAATRFSKSETSRRPFISFVSVKSRKCSDETSNHLGSFAASSAGIDKTNRRTNTIRRLNLIVSRPSPVVGPVMDHAHLFQRDKAFRNHGVEYREKCFNFFQAVDDFDNHRQVFGQTQDLGRTHHTVPAEAHNAAQDCRAGKPG